MYKGIGVSPGIGMAKAIIIEKMDLIIPETKIEASLIEKELEQYSKAKQRAKDELLEIKEHALRTVGKEKAEIIEAQIMFLEDPTIVNEISNLINDGNNSAFAIHKVVESQALMFESLPVPEMRERAVDMRDMGRRVINILLRRKEVNLSAITESVVIVTHDLTPSDTAQLSKDFVTGIVTEIGSSTSHTAILARTLGIPAVVGVKGIVGEIENGLLIGLDGDTGEVIINPNEKQQDTIKQNIAGFAIEEEKLSALVEKEAVTANGKPVRIAANIGKLEDAIEAKKLGAQEIGLFRTEFLYMDRTSLPTEEEQYQSYKQVVEMFSKKVIIRTLDIGGDKELPYLKQAKELNPFLGKRAIRLTLAEKPLFKTQLRAILRASIHGTIGIMFPMISTIEELLAAKSLLQHAKEELEAEGLVFSRPIEIGMMMETPAAALAADLFATEVDFFSIGTNDLIQYTMAADRMNEEVAYLYQPNHPAIIRLIEIIANAAHQADIWVGMCGEMAGNPEWTELLLRMGLDELSMTRGSLLKVKQKISQIEL